MDSPRKAEDSLNTVMIVAIGVIGSLFVWASIVALQAYYDKTAGAEAHRREIAGQSEQLRSLHAAANEILGKYGKSSTGKVAIPIERAMELVVRDGNTLSLVPAVGPHDKPTIPATFGRPSDKPAVPAPPPPSAPTSAPTGGVVPPGAVPSPSETSAKPTIPSRKEIIEATKALKGESLTPAQSGKPTPVPPTPPKSRGQ